MRSRSSAMVTLTGERLTGGMNQETIRALTIYTAVGSGAAGGVYFAFSTFIMKALNRLPAGQSIDAMKAINKDAPGSPLFMLLLFVTAVTALILGIRALIRTGEPGGVLLVVGGALYLVSLMVTMAYHVPHNDALMKVDSSAPSAAETWKSFIAGWNPWNHVRTVTALAAAASFTLALRSAAR